MSYRAWEPNAIGSIVPPFGGSSGGGGGGGSEDRFAPKWLVGNTLNGDTATTTGTAAGFTYIADPGDGTGILAAVNAANAAGGGDVWIRPGLYNYNLGALTGPITIGANVRVVGAGTSTIIQTLTTADQGAFILGGQRATLSELRIVSTAAPIGVGSAALVSAIATDTRVENVRCEVATDPFGVLREGIRVNNTSRVSVVGCLVTGAHTGISIGPENPTAIVVVTRCTSINNAKYGIRVENTFASIIRIEDCTIGVLGESGPVYGVWLRSTRSSIIGCYITQSNRLSGSAIRVVADVQTDAFNAIADNVIVCATDYGIALESSRKTTVTGNAVFMTTGNAVNGILLDLATRSTVASNTVDNAQGVGAAIESNATGCAITGNALEVTDSIAAISLTGTSGNNTVGFNTSGATTPVSDAGTGNEVAHNI